MTIDEIKKAIREIEISYDYNHSKNDYDIVLNLTELANLIKTLQDKAVDDFAEKLNEKCDGMIKDKWNSNVAPISWAEAYADFKDDINDIAEQLKGDGENEQGI